MAVPINLTARLNRLYCHDEGDGWGDAAPYLWAVFFKIDGDTFAHQQGAGLIGSPVIVSTHGGHGNLGLMESGTTVDAGTTVSIPQSIGDYGTVLRPIPVNDPGLAGLLPDGNLPAITGVVATVMEEDGWPHSLANDGYSAFVNAVHLAVVKVAAEFQRATQAPTPDEIRAAVDRVKSEAGASVRQAVKGSMDAWELLWFGTFGDNDDEVGTEAFTTDSEGLRTTPDIDFSRRWSGNNSGDGDWELFGWFSGTALPVIPGGCNLDGLFARTAADETTRSRSFDFMRQFRDGAFRRYVGLASWWAEIQDAAPQLAHLAAGDEQVRRALEALLAEVPRWLSDPAEVVRPEDAAHGRLLLERLSAASPQHAERFARQGLRALAEVDGLAWNQALDFMSRAKPRGRTLRERAQRSVAATRSVAAAPVLDGPT